MDKVVNSVGNNLRFEMGKMDATTSKRLIVNVESILMWSSMIHTAPGVSTVGGIHGGIKVTNM